MAYATGSVKDLVNAAGIAPQESWLETCRSHGWICSVCGNFPTDLSNAPAYESGLCPRCTDPLPD
ncbi:MAG TPA: hypothetical protein VNN17_12675 [Terriglobia bacterium]|nr:hypothetical protein [Terriglobia bacterium]